MNATLAAQRLDTMQSRVVHHPRSGGSLGIVGDAGAGKTFALVARAQRLADESEGQVLLCAPSDGGVARLRAARGGDRRENLVCASFGDVAFDVLRTSLGREVEAIDDVTASSRFESVGATLFALDWTELVTAEIDPEIPGLRAPERFAAAAFRLIRKLRASLLSPEDFRSAGLRGATTFYASPPNLADAALLQATPPKYRDSLRADAAELERQRRREVDLVRILARLYGSYVEALVATGRLTPSDAVFETAIALRASSLNRQTVRQRYAAILVDDAQDLTAAQMVLLEGISHEGLTNVTFAGDPQQNTLTFAGGGRGVLALRDAATVVELTGRHRCTAAVAEVASLILAGTGGAHAAGSPGPRAAAQAEVEAGNVALYRANDMRDEARYVADEVARRIALGTPPQRIAVIARNLRCSGTYVDALLARGVPVDIAGTASIFDFRAVRDALGALWSAADPYRHDYLLRALESPWVGLSDASLALLCREPDDPQPPLFDLSNEDVENARSSRWDSRRNLRLARNVTHGDVDATLSADARSRLARFREMRARWTRLHRELDPPAVARVVLDETVAATLPDDARGRFERHLVARLLDALDAAAEREPLASLRELLERIERIASAEYDLLSLQLRDERAVHVLDVESAKGRTFAAVFAVDVRAGAWPRYYAPDAFLFLPSLGMVPKENVGDARTGRTAKFTYALSSRKLREKYDLEDRRALYVALTRATEHVSVSAWGRPTRGAATPEFLEELRARLSS